MDYPHPPGNPSAQTAIMGLEGVGRGSASRTGPVVGFDLDMTLVDSAAGIVATLQAALAEVGAVPVPGPAPIRAGIGAPLEHLIAGLAPAADPAAVAARYRTLYPDLGVPTIRLLPGAGEALAAVHALGGTVLVVSAKVEPAVRLVLRRVGLLGGPGTAQVDAVAGGLFAGHKGVWLRRAGADAYVGDHPGDVEAARIAGATAVAVGTGPHGEAALRAAGADIVLAGLPQFPRWLGTWWTGGTGQRAPCATR
jgi:phosphoglycolate phosphatase